MACYEIKLSDRLRGFACVLNKLWQAITLRIDRQIEQGLMSHQTHYAQE